MRQTKLANEVANMSQSERRDDARLEPLKEGSTRLAYRFLQGPLKGRVIKIATCKMARDENKHEMQTWMKVKHTDDGQLFCPIRHKDEQSHQWLIMDYADPVSGPVGILKSKIQSRKLKQAVEDSYDRRSHNIGTHSTLGTVIFDYPWAYNEERYA